MIKLSAAIKIENREEYLMVQESAHTAVLSKQRHVKYRIRNVILPL